MKRARIRTTHACPHVVAESLAPDNTASMTTRVDGDAVETTIERETTGGLHSSVDDYVVNLAVADRLTTRGPEDVETADTETSRDAQTADHHTDTTHHDNE